MKRQIVRIEDISDIKLLHEGWKNATKGGKYWRKSTHEYEVNLDSNLRSLPTVCVRAHGGRHQVTPSA